MSISMSSVSCAANAPKSRISLSLIIAVWAERRVLSRLDESRLNDLGFTSAEAAREAARPFWDLPLGR